MLINTLTHDRRQQRRQSFRHGQSTLCPKDELSGAYQTGSIATNRFWRADFQRIVSPKKRSQLVKGPAG